MPPDPSRRWPAVGLSGRRYPALWNSCRRMYSARCERLPLIVELHRLPAMFVSC